MTLTETGVSDYGAPFWSACERGELVVQHCPDCDSNIFPPEPICPGCLGSSAEWVPSRLTGYVYSFSVVHRSPAPEFPTPYVLAVVDMDDGWSLLSNVVADETSGGRFERLRSGARVRAEFVERPDRPGAMPVFRAIPTGRCG